MKRPVSPDPRYDTGFTLLEVLVVLALAGMVLAMLGLGFRFGLSARGLQERALRGVGDTEVVDQTIRRLVERIDPGLSASDPPPFEGGPHQVRFVSGNRTTTIQIASGRGLVLAYATPFDTVTGDRRIGISTLLDGVAGLDIRYWKPGTGWIVAWTEPLLPALIRFHFIFPKDAQRTAPDVIVAPMRAQWRS